MGPLNRFFQKMPKTRSGLLAVLLIQFFLLPFYHYHPDSVHGHADQLQPHRHRAHFHSPVLEQVAHLGQLHPENPARDARKHHPHSSRDHDSHPKEFQWNKTLPWSLKLGTLPAAVPASGWFEVPRPEPWNALTPVSFSLPSLPLFSQPPERSPPARV